MRKPTAPQRRSASSTATPRAIGSWIRSETTMIRPLLMSARVNALLAKSCVKLSRPTNFCGQPSPFQLKKPYQPASPIGRTMKTVKRNERRRQEDDDGRQSAARIGASRTGEGFGQGHWLACAPLSSGLNHKRTPAGKPGFSRASDRQAHVAPVQRWSQASWIAAAASSGLDSPAAMATDMSLTTRPTAGPRSWSKKF